MMGTTAQKLAKLAEVKETIRLAINDKGVEVSTTDTFATYPSKIAEIQTGITPSGNVELQKQSGTDVTNYATASAKSGSVSVNNKTKAQSTPTISVSNAGLITASVAATSQTVDASVTEGWISSATSGTVTMSASSATQQLTTQAAKTITPSTSQQTAVESGKYTTGNVVVSAVPTETKTATDNGTITPSSGKFLSSVTVNVPYKIYHTGSGAPASSLGNDGDIYIDLS